MISAFRALRALKSSVPARCGLFCGLRCFPDPGRDVGGDFVLMLMLVLPVRGRRLLRLGPERAGEG